MDTKTAQTEDANPYPDSEKDVGRIVGELQSFGLHYIAAQVARVKVLAVKGAVFGAVGVVLLAVTIAVAFTATVLACVGIAGGLGKLFGNQLWLGQLVFGIGILALVLMGLLIGLRVVLGASRRQVARDFTERKRQQRRDFGADVHDRATQSARV